MFKGLAKFVQLFLDAIVAVLNFVAGIFPASPFSILDRVPELSSLIADINYFVPLYECLAIAEAWLVAVGIYYAVSILARWVKAIE